MIKQTASQVLGRSGERWFQSQVPGEWVFEPPAEDIGLDGKVITGTSGSIGELEFGVQIKARRKWKIKRGVIDVPGIRRQTLRYWGTRLFPIMLVVYDVEKDLGYWGWLYDVLSSPVQLLEAPTKTVTLKVRSSSLLDKRAWPKIRRDVTCYYENLVNSLAAIRLQANVLPTIHSLAMALDLLIMRQFQHTASEDEEMLLQLGEIKAHGAVLDSLRELANKFSIDPGSPHPLGYFEDRYRRILSGCVQNVADLEIKDRAMAIWTNQERMASSRPTLIRMLTDLIARLTGDLPAPTKDHDMTPNPTTPDGPSPPLCGSNGR